MHTKKVCQGTRDGRDAERVTKQHRSVINTPIKLQIFWNLYLSIVRESQRKAAKDSDKRHTQVTRDTHERRVDSSYAQDQLSSENARHRIWV